MKTMTCKQLGGACDMEFYTATFEEMAHLSQKHAKEMQKKGDEDHINAMVEMRILMKNPDNMRDWMKNKRKEFEGLI